MSLQRGRNLLQPIVRLPNEQLQKRPCPPRKKKPTGLDCIQQDKVSRAHKQFSLYKQESLVQTHTVKVDSPIKKCQKTIIAQRLFKKKVKSVCFLFSCQFACRKLRVYGLNKKSLFKFHDKQINAGDKKIFFENQLPHIGVLYHYNYKQYTTDMHDFGPCLGWLKRSISTARDQFTYSERVKQILWFGVVLWLRCLRKKNKNAIKAKYLTRYY